MDPKYGEISRAMRNRGVEIYVAPESLSLDYSHADMRTLLGGLGLPLELSKQLIKVHLSMREELHDVGNIPSLLLAASLTMEYLRTGQDQISALQDACTNVYVTSQLLTSNQRRSSEILEAALKRAVSGEKEPDDVEMRPEEKQPEDVEMKPVKPDEEENVEKQEAGGSSVVPDDTRIQLPSVGVMKMDSASAMIHRDVAVVEYVCQKLSDPEINEGDIPLLVRQLYHSVLGVILGTTHKDFQLRCDWLANVLSRLPNQLRPSITPALKQMCNNVHQSPLYSHLKKELRSDTEVWMNLENLPFDLHSKHQLVDYLRYSSSSPLLKVVVSEDEKDVRGRMVEKSVEAGRRLHLMLWKEFIDWNTFKEFKENQQTPWTYSAAFSKGQLTIDDLPHPAFAHLYQFFESLGKLMELWINKELPVLTELSMFQVKVCYRWITWFRQACHQPVTSAERFSIGLLALHWSWVQRKALDVLMKSLTGVMSIPVKFEALVNSLDHSLGLPAVAVERIWKSATEYLQLPTPYKTEEQANMSIRLQKLCEKCEIKPRHNRKFVWNLMRLFERNPSVGQQLLKCLQRVANLDGDDGVLLEEVVEIEKKMELCLEEEKHEEDGEMREIAGGTVNEDICNQLQFKAMLLPFQELLSLKQSQCLYGDVSTILLQKILNRSTDEEQEIVASLHSLLVFNSSHPGVNYRHFLSLWSASQDSSLDNSSWTELCSSSLTSLQQSPVLISPLKWRESLLISLREQLLPQIDLKRNPALVLAPIQTFQSFNLLCPVVPDFSSPPTTSSSSPVLLCDPVISRGVPLACWEDRLSQLEEFSRLMWSNCGWMNTAEQSYRNAVMKSLFTSVCWLLSSLKSLIPGDSEASWEHCMNQLCDLLLTPKSDLSCNRESPNLLEKTLSLIMDLLSSGSQNVVTHGRGRLSTPMIKSLTDFHSEILKWTRTLLKEVSALLSLVDEESGLLEVTNQVSVIKQFQWMVSVGSCWMCLGYLQTSLLAPRGPVDPAQRRAVKLKCVQDEIADLKAQLEVISKKKELLTGQKLFEVGNQIPERVKLISNHLEKLIKKEEKLSRRVAFRPTPSQFDQLRYNISHYMESIGSSASLEGFMQSITVASSFLVNDGGKRLKTNKKIQALMREIEGWRKSLQQFLTNLEEAYPTFKDLWAGLAMGAQGMAVGSHFVQHGLEAGIHRCSLDWGTEEISTLETSFIQLTQFPFTSSLIQADNISDERFGALCQTVLIYHHHGDSEKALAEWNKYQVRFLKLSLLHVANHIQMVRAIDDSSWQSLQSILGTFVEWWHKAEEERKRKEEEEASLFKYKKQTHGSDEKPEDEEEKDLKKTFPSYEKDFSDLNADPTKDPEPMQEEMRKEDSEDSNHFISLDVETQSLVQGIHHYLFTTSNESVENSVLQSDIKDTLSQCYRCAAQVFSDTIPWMVSKADSSLIGSHLAVSKIHQDTINGTNRGHHVMTTDKPFDIYHDPSPSEVIKCRPLLVELTKRISELLVEWPEHPTLQHLVLLISRIESFPVNSPLMKFVTGLELLLEKAQDWESVAAKYVSLQAQLGPITQLVIEWRKTELSCWSSSLDSVAYHHKQGVIKWWFHIFKVIQNITSDPVKMNHPSDTGIHGDNEETEESDEGAWLTSLQKFLESSTIGDFQSRLDIILAFYSQLSRDVRDTTPGHDWKTSAVSILWNLHRYYQQFLPGVTEEMSKLRSPLEKELKEFVKICRWNDINFWAMKAAVEKSHKTVHKLCKKFQAALEGAAKVVFTDAKLKGKSTWAEECVEESEITKELWIHDFDGSSKLHHTHNAGSQGLNETSVKKLSVSMTFDPTSLMSRLSSLSDKMKKYCKALVRTSLLDEVVVTLDDFGSEVIANVKELQALEVTKDAEKEKQKSEAKHINLRKRKALSDLFKHLSSLGLSYRKGLIMSNENTMREMFNLPKIESTSVSSSVRCVIECSKLSETLKTKLDKSEHYFFLNHARKAALLTTLENPSKELGLPNLDRCRGFSEHLSKVTLEQRRQIGLVASQLDKLGNISSQLFSLGDSLNSAGSVGLPPQREAESWLCETKQLFDKCLYVVIQYQILLDSCPVSATEKEGEKHLVSPLPEESLSPFERMRKRDENWLKMSEKFKMIERGLTSLKPSLDHSQEVIRNASKAGITQLMFWSDIDTLDKCFSRLKNCSKTMSDILKSFWIEKSQEFGRVADVLSQLKSDVIEKVEKFEEWRSFENVEDCLEDRKEDDKESKEGLRIEEVEQLLSGLLLAIQNITQQHQGRSQEQTECKSHTSKEEESNQQLQLQKSQLTEKLGTNLTEDIAALNIAKIVKLASSLLHDVKSAANDVQGQHCQDLIQMVLKILPIMLHYQKLSAYYFSQLVSAHKSSCKLLYILLGIFNELAEKGFCLPAEFSDELSGEGATDFQDIEGGGIDDGEGVKDVSDQIEDEEQVQDVHREGEEKEKDNENQDDIKNEENGIEMSEDFEGKMHDMEPQEANSDEEDDGVDEDELDKQMGDVDQPDADKLDEKMWGDEDDKEKGEEEEEDKEKKEELGDGDEEEAESQLVAKDDNTGDSPDDKNKDKKQEKKEEDSNEMEIPEPNELMEPFDESEYNDDDIDPSKANEPPPEAVPEDMDLPDDLNLEDQDGEDEEEGDGDEGNEENPFDIETPVQEMDVDEKDDGKEEDDGKEKEAAGEESKEDEKKETDEDETKEDEMEGVEEGRAEETAEEEQKDKTEDPEETGEDTKTENYLPDKPHEVEEIPQDAENSGKSAEDTENIQATESMATDEAGKSDSKNSEEEEAMGLSEAQQESGHEGAANSKTAISTQTSQEPSTAKRKPGHSDSDRSLGQEEQGAKRLKTVDAPNKEEEEKEEDKGGENRNNAESDLYEHLKESQSHYDVQAIDTATEEQVKEAGMMKDTLDEEDDPAGAGEEEEMPVMQEMESVEEEKVDKKLEGQSYPSGKSEVGESQKEDAEEPSPDVTDMKGNNEESVTGQTTANNASTIHTKYSDSGETTVPDLVLTDPEEVETVRKEIEKQLSLLHDSSNSTQENLKAQRVWHECEAVTSSLARELCEQLRLVLEPTQASKLRGDFRTGKRINMRKVIPYIASGFRKDKIWLRRTKPSKREYQILLAVDDSSSMADNRSRQMAFESMALVSNALTWLEAGQLAVCSFGESVQLIHPFHEQFSDQSGSKILQEFTFSQKKTKIAQLLKYVTSLMALAKMHQAPGGTINVQISQLVLVMSDGRGLFLEGMEKVKSAVRAARDANIFLVFLILDNPENKDSILDIKVPFFKEDGLPEIHSYMEHFPFPFYILLRDINALPETLSDALRQWFELVTAGDS
ncbi:Midasin [Holothuria leucospilota]|uniref:Midasin n=1 Tax=Holothuria leucospilota TaxID=206669 RepID=A0A9Q1C642_HOLLE|nr:Midasin [Holothuria leucospilota]